MNNELHTAQCTVQAYSDLYFMYSDIYEVWKRAEV